MRCSSRALAALVVLGLLAGLTASSAFGGAAAHQAKKCNKYTQRKVGKRCVKRPTPPAGVYRAKAPGVGTMIIFKSGKKLLVNASTVVPRTNLTCAPKGSAPRSGETALVNGMRLSGKSFSGGDASETVGPAKISGSFLSALKVRMTAEVSDRQVGTDNDDRCAGSVTVTLTLIPPS